MHSATKPFAELPDGWLPHPTSTKLKFEPPFDWHAMLGYLTPRAIPGVEIVADNSYSRTLSSGGAFGLLRVTGGSKGGLVVELVTNEEVESVGLTRALRRLFDLDTDPSKIVHHFEGQTYRTARRQATRHQDPWLLGHFRNDRPSDPGPASLRRRRDDAHRPLGPPARGAAVRTIGHPQAYACLPNAAGARRCRPGGSCRAAPRTRARSISGLAAVVAGNPALLGDQGELGDVVARLVALPGIGPWTANYVAMRGLRKNDAFPKSDLGLLRAATKPGRERLKPAELLRLAERWRPLRGYAAMHPWLSATS